MYKLLIVDDEYLVRTGLRTTVDWAALGVIVAGEAADGLEALELAKKESPDLIITDVRMPRMDGIELIERLNAERSDCAVIVLSGYKDFEYVKATLENGVHSYLLKPIDNEELIRCVLCVLEKLKKSRHGKKYLSQLEEELPTIRNKLVYDVLQGNFDDETTLREKLDICKITLPVRGTLIFGMAEGAEEGERSALLRLFDVCARTDRGGGRFIRDRMLRYILCGVLGMYGYGCRRRGVSGRCR